MSFKVNGGEERELIERSGMWRDIGMGTDKVVRLVLLGSQKENEWKI